MNRQLLEEPFAPHEIKSREGNFGKRLSYIEGHSVLQRLNDAFEGQWSFEIIEYKLMEHEVLVLGRLTTGEIVKSQFGSSQITRARESGKPLSIGDDLKAAATDALKKCSVLLGVGLHLYKCKVNGARPGNSQHQGGYSESASNGHRPPQGSNRDNGDTPRNGTSSTNGSSVNGNGRSTGTSNSRLSQKQLRYLLNLNDELGKSEAELNKYCIARYGQVAKQLTKVDAQSLIKSLLIH